MFIPCKICGSSIDFSPIRTNNNKIIRSRQLELCYSCLDDYDKGNMAPTLDTEDKILFKKRNKKI
jgi:ribosome-binding protein aMBF1 (putative translation factor)